MGVTLIPTVRVTFLNGGHDGHISAKDFDPQLHVLWVDPAVKSVEEKVVLKVLAEKAVDAEVIPTEEQQAEDTLAEERAARRAASIAKAQAAAAAKRAEKRAEKEVDPQ